MTPATATRWVAETAPRGIAGGAVRAVTSPAADAAPTALVSDVPAAEFDQVPLDRNVADTDWLGRHAAAHQAVNAAALEALGAVIPLGFGTIFRHEAGIRRLLSDRDADLAAALAAVAGRAEWVGTLDRDATLAREHLARLRQAQQPDAAPPGRSYLLRRKGEVEGIDALRQLDRDAREEFRQALDSIAEQRTDEPLIEGGPVARATVLVARDREPDLNAALESFAARWTARGYSPRLAGPWPAYRFAARLETIVDG